MAGSGQAATGCGSHTGTATKEPGEPDAAEDFPEATNIIPRSRHGFVRSTSAPEEPNIQWIHPTSCDKVPVRIAGYIFLFFGVAMEDLDEMASLLLSAVRAMPPGKKRHDALKEIGIMRSRMLTLIQQSVKSKSNTHANPTPVDD